MPYSDYRPELMGSATIEPSGSFEAGSWQTFTLTYTCGKFGIDDTGSLKIGMRFATDFGPVQFDSPKAPGYTTVKASNGADLEYRWEFKRNIRPWSRALWIGVKKHFLSEGDTITICFGDQSQGSPGVRLQTYCETGFEFRIFVDAIATYDYVALPTSPKIHVAPGEPKTWRAALPTLVRVGETFRLSIKADDKWGNPSNLIDRTLKLEANLPVEGLPSTLRFLQGDFASIVDDLVMREPGELSVRILDDEGAELCCTNILKAITDTPLVHYWGDLHGQSNETLGTNTAREYFLFGRDRAFLDVCAHQGNDFQITNTFWQDLNALTAELEEPGRFVAIPGYEWSANTAVGGDRNVFYAREGRPIYRSSHAQVPDLSDEATDGHNAHELFERLTSEDCVVWAHCGGRYADIKYAHDGTKEASVEVHSSWGTFEWLLRDALEKNYRIGVVCNSDGHKGRVGASYPGASFFGAYGGLTCFLAPELTRDAIFEAMRRRHHYGTTGTRLYLDVRVKLPEGGECFHRDPDLQDTMSAPVNELIMGDIARVTSEEVELSINVIGSAPIERLDIYDGLDHIATYRPYEDKDLGRRIRLTYKGAEYRGRARTTTWDGHLTLEGNTIEYGEMFNNWNLDRGFEIDGPRNAHWKAVTTGNYGGVDLWLDDKMSGRLSFETAHVAGKISIADIGREPLIFEAGGLGRAVKVQRLPDNPSNTRVKHSLYIPIRSKSDTRLYTRIQQIDGHRAWSSPVYLFKK